MTPCERGSMGQRLAFVQKYLSSTHCLISATVLAANVLMTGVFLSTCYRLHYNKHWPHNHGFLFLPLPYPKSGKLQILHCNKFMHITNSNYMADCNKTPFDGTTQNIAVNFDWGLVCIVLITTFMCITYAVPHVLLKLIRKLNLCRTSVSVGIINWYGGLHSVVRTYSTDGNIPLDAALVCDI